MCFKLFFGFFRELVKTSFFMRLVKTLGQNLGQILPECFYRFLEKVGFHDTLRPALVIIVILKQFFCFLRFCSRPPKTAATPTTHVEIRTEMPTALLLLLLCTSLAALQSRCSLGSRGILHAACRALSQVNLPNYLRLSRV